MITYILRALTETFQLQPPYVIPIFGPFIILFIIIIIRNKKTPFSNLLLNIISFSMLFIYFMGVLMVTRIAEIPFATYERILDDRNILYPLEFQMVPFESLMHIVNFYGIGTEIFGNLLLLLPLGFFIPLFSKSNINFFKTFLIIMLTSILIEFSQVLFGVGIGSIDDLLLNTLGGLFGYIIFKLGKYWILERPTRSIG